MERKCRLIPSIASADQLRVAEEIDKVRDWGLLHIDVEDGNFVPNITFGEKMIRSIAGYASQQLDAHLLTNDPAQYLPVLDECGFKMAAAHIEALPYPLEFLNRAKAMGMEAGLALNFSTPAEAVLPFSSRMDYVIVMTAEPDDHGQQYFPPMLEKIRRLQAILPAEVSVWADGGINGGNMRAVLDAGADTLIMGRCVFGTPDPLAELKKLSDFE